MSFVCIKVLLKVCSRMKGLGNEMAKRGLQFCNQYNFFKENLQKPTLLVKKRGVGEAGFEPATSRLSAGCSNQPKLPAQG